ncbi:16S rRNA (cytidine(1402)-2'-O)-methyltransferase [Rhodobacterales bacterium 52_120_T64]|nr:16S rRNA (cytidine(1402)-2'-O)-methyltransferase [Rhodobacterales bacterium 52_120_T64]
MSKLTPTLSAGLYLVSTPIGTASDITLRALDILANADVLAAEDTRNTRKLMDIHGVKLNGRPLMPYHDHNGPAQRPRILAAIKAGKSVAYVSDAGTPLIADPGYRLAADTISEGLPVTSAPGASALLAALAIAGLPTDRFLFAGFPPVKSVAKAKFLTEFANVPATLVFYESPRRLADCLKAMEATFGGGRRVAVCRELTKKFEEVRRGTLAELAAQYGNEPAPKGEVVIVVGPPLSEAASVQDIDTALLSALKTQSVKDAAKEVAEALDLPRKQLYARALELK